MRRLLAWADKGLIVIGNVFLAGFLTIVVIQVFARYVLQYPLPWTEELGVYLFVWASFVAAAVVVGMNDHFSIAFLADGLSATRRRILDVVGTILCMMFTLIMIVKGAEWSWRMVPASSSALQISQGAVYAILPLTGLYMLAHLAVRLRGILGADPITAPVASPHRGESGVL
jgi:TRAP-type transport system small permease protein